MFPLAAKQRWIKYIRTYLHDWYLDPVTIPNIASSDHCAISLLPLNNKPQTSCDRITVTARSNSTNVKHLLAHALHNFKWKMLKTIDNIDSKVAYFNTCVTALLDFFLPIHIEKRRTDDKPWLTDQFRQLIRRGQYALTSGNRSLYNQLRNEAISYRNDSASNFMTNVSMACATVNRGIGGAKRQS
jgi:hypothetical protein